MTFFARKIRRYYTCDMFIRLHRSLGQDSKSGNFCQDLDYSAHSFDGIQLWDLVDHLDDDDEKSCLFPTNHAIKKWGKLRQQSVYLHATKTKLLTD